MFYILFSIITIPLLYLFTKSYINTHDVVINKININADGSNQPGTLVNILQLSDLHLENISITPEQLYHKLKDQPIDLIALTGDFLDRKRTIPQLIPYLHVLKRLDAKYGMYAVLGNHDYVLKDENLKKLIHTLESNNCNVLRNQHETISVHGQRLNIIGVDDFSTKRSELDIAYKDLKPATNLVLTHDPNIVLHMKNYHFDYLLSGHFHGGQICYPKAYHLATMGKLAKMNIIKGLHKHDGKPFYINEGLGQTGMNIRLGSRPEITIHQLAMKTVDQTLMKANEYVV
ncbi:metallophosphoesterase [Bacillaceae bacterium SIJ1]|uniref:metallophosphoesterase n=1 Tax=Litoribacterium kuwaitense TaxID=1398745 RepID=UPI0013EAA2EC|nr:metallophosphoesterase [Litoribacterium kuwaitense]NGP45129.1 metallophosphoesterase [Litoribacterium kuwaitense]